LRARGACSVNIDWKGGNLVKAGITSDKGGTFTIRYKEKTRKVTLKPGESLNVNGLLET
jgi:hypothetical protein